MHGKLCPPHSCESVNSLFVIALCQLGTLFRRHGHFAACRYRCYLNSSTLFVSWSPWLVCVFLFVRLYVCLLVCFLACLFLCLSVCFVRVFVPVPVSVSFSVFACPSACFCFFSEGTFFRLVQPDTKKKTKIFKCPNLFSPVPRAWLGCASFRSGKPTSRHQTFAPTARMFPPKLAGSQQGINRGVYKVPEQEGSFPSLTSTKSLGGGPPHLPGLAAGGHLQVGGQQATIELQPPQRTTHSASAWARPTEDAQPNQVHKERPSFSTPPSSK